jgi:hypothetical protein
MSLALNGRATILLKDGHNYGIKGEGQYDLAGHYSRQAKHGATQIELEVHTQAALSTSPKRRFGRSQRSSASSSRCQTRRYTKSCSQRPTGR